MSRDATTGLVSPHGDGTAHHAAAPPAPLHRSADGSVAAVIEDVVGCKWTLRILARIRDGVVRPGALQRSIDGLTTKVLNERLAKLMGYGLLEKQMLSERPLHVEYRLTAFGGRINAILDEIDALQRDIDGAR